MLHKLQCLLQQGTGALHQHVQPTQQDELPRYTLIKFAGDTKMGRATDMLEDKVVFHRKCTLEK